jgi:hypothetical protein
VPLVDLIDETFMVCDPSTLAARFRDPNAWPVWWPDFRLSVFMDRGVQGIRWSISGALVGSCEVWLEQFGDGTIVHYYLRGDPPSPQRRSAARRLGWRLGRREAIRWKRRLNALKDELEAGRPPGCPRWTGSPS